MPFPPGKSGNELTQFQPGQSGNPAGHPLGVPNRATVLKKFLALSLDYKNPSTGEFETGTMEDAVVLGLLAAASRGDVAAYKEVMDSVYGKLVAAVDLTSAGQALKAVGVVTVEIIGTVRPPTTSEKDVSE